ncbi:hypothetical protein BSNT_10723 [Bacillus subtilis subsp. natto BEST195]|nr:hypothetical protein BSNT_10723 [Bacillus subtilis subsp. natto BEST195]
MQIHQYIRQVADLYISPYFFRSCSFFLTDPD